MIYVMSDIHGCYNKFTAMLEKINFKDSDTLYILGDLVDKGEDGIKLVMDVMNRPNVISLRGNHDHEAAILLLKLADSTQDKNRELTELESMWLYDGEFQPIRLLCYYVNPIRIMLFNI